MTTLIAHGPGRHLRSPRWSRVSGRPTLQLIAAHANGERLVLVTIDADGTTGDLVEVPAPDDRILDLSRDHEPRPIARVEELDGMATSDCRVWVEQRGYRAEVVLAWHDGPKVAVARLWGTATWPAVATTEEGAWVAFHHNVREDTGRADLAKWIALRFVDRAGQLFAPAAPMVDRDRDRRGEDQSFEFPAVALGADGAVALYGRASHRFYRQDLSAAGFAPRRAIDDEGWGCRGRGVAVTTDGSAILRALRSREGIVVARDAQPTGGAPLLVTTDAEIGAAGPADGATGPFVAIASTSRSSSAARSAVDDPAAQRGRRTLFGDIHQHSAHSDGIGSADEPYLRARHVYGDDFCALTDHESFLGKRIGRGEWAYLEAVAEAHDDPGAFATLIAYEWTGKMHPGPGHKVVYCSRPGLPILSRDELPAGADLLRLVAEQGGFAVPHHVGWTGADEDAHDERLQPVWEICSCHGCYESFGHSLGQRGDLRDQMVDAVLARGKRFGFIASSDGHGLLWHHGVARKRDPFRTGLTAVQARACDRQSILSAIRERRCYATSGAKILLDLDADGAPMGTAMAASAAMTVRAQAIGEGDVARLELVGRAGVIAQVDGRGRSVTVTASVDGEPYVYARVVQVDGEMAWSSPIFFADPAPSGVPRSGTSGGRRRR